MAVSEKRRLARGLDALFGGTAEPTPAGSNPTTVPIDQIEANPYQPRQDFDAGELASLKESLDRHGLLQPVVVRPTERGYQLIAGERRVRAAREAGWHEVPVHIVDFDDRQVFEAAMVENLHRSDLNPIEKAYGFQDYMNQYGVTQEELARRVGLDRSTISNLVRLLELPPAVQEAVRLGQISNGHARALLALDDPDRQVALCRRIVENNLSVRAVENLVKQERDRSGSSKSPSTPDKTAHVRSIEDELRRRFATRVEIRLRSQDSGQIILTFDSNEDFERIVEELLR